VAVGQQRPAESLTLVVRMHGKHCEVLVRSAGGMVVLELVVEDLETLQVRSHRQFESPFPKPSFEQVIGVFVGV
jgi:hypothetical protein